MPHSLRGWLLRAAAVVATGLLPLAANTAPVAASNPLYLLRPTGPSAVGATFIYLKDTSRPDPWVPKLDARELMVTVWYPTRSTGGARAPYMTPEESRLFLEGKRSTDLPPDILSTVRTNAYIDARPAGRAHSLPLVVLSPGHTQPRNSLSSLAEDLASHGYVVVAIDHTYETYAVTFPDGRIATCAACEVDDDPEAFRAKQHQSRAIDVSFVLDRLTGPHPAWQGGRLIDMDGTTAELIPASGLSRPFMFLGAPYHSPGGPDTTLDRDWDLMTGWKRWLLVAGTQHASFNDLALFGDQLGIDFGATTTGTRSTQITRRYNLAMFDLHLRHQPQSLLDGPSPCYPEVAFAAR